MKIKTSELTERQLVWAVAKAEGYIDDCNSWLYLATVEEANDSEGWKPLTWSVAGPIIQREGINTFKYNKLDESEPDKWCAHKVVPRKAMDGIEYGAALGLDGPTPLIAAMRCYCASRLGDEIEIPDALV